MTKGHSLSIKATRLLEGSMTAVAVGNCEYTKKVILIQMS